MTKPIVQLVRGKYGHSRGDVGRKFNSRAIQINKEMKGYRGGRGKYSHLPCGELGLASRSGISFFVSYMVLLHVSK
jgi:hypothetical protein